MDNFLHHYAEILSDPAHLAVELTLMLLVDGLVLGLIWPALRRTIDHRVRMEHRLIDDEHGYDHRNDDGH